MAICFLSSCKYENKVSSIPNSIVYYRLPINSKLARALTPGGIVKVKNSNNIGEILPPKGIAIVRSIDKDNVYYAFSLICPYDYPNNVVELNIGGIELICPKCKSHYQVVYGAGIPIKGISKLPLRRYNVFLDNNELVVRN